MKKRHLGAATLVLCMAMSSLPMASAAQVATPGANGDTPVTLTAEATTFSVTVPTSIAIHVNADGSVTCPTADTVKIVNNSAGPVKVTNIAMTNGAWSLVSYNGGNRADMAAAGVDSKHLGFQMAAGGDTVATSANGNQTLTHDATKWVIGALDTGDNELPITCAAIASAVSAEITTAETAATVVFTLGWDFTDEALVEWH